MGETTTAITAVKKEVRMRDWAEQVKAQKASGMTVQKWCEENGINPKTYYYHLRKLREKCAATAPAIVPLAAQKLNCPPKSGHEKCNLDQRNEPQAKKRYYLKGCIVSKIESLAKSQRND